MPQEDTQGGKENFSSSSFLRESQESQVGLELTK